MNFSGADIRVVNIPKEKLVELVREFIGSNQLHKEKDEELDAKVTHITVSNPIDSYLKFWWNGAAQIIDWNIVELEKDETKIETRFGFHKRYRIWFWTVLAALTALIVALSILVFRESALESFDLHEGYIGTLEICAIALITNLVLILLFLGKSTYCIHVQFLEPIWKLLQTPERGYSIRIQQCNCENPDNHRALIFVTLGASIILASNLDAFSSILKVLAPFWVIISLLLLWISIASIIWYFCRKNKYFGIRYGFGQISIAFVIPLLIFYILPHLNIYEMNVAQKYSQHLRAAKQLKDNSDSYIEKKTKDSKFVLRNFYLVLSFAYISCITIAIMIFAYTPKKAKNLLKFRRIFNSGMHWTLYYKGVVDFRSYANIFRVLIFAEWISLSIIIFVLAYIILSIFEFTIFKKNLVFMSKTGMNFYYQLFDILRYFFASHINQRTIDLVGRFCILVYCLPLISLLGKLVNKRVQSYLRKLKEFKRYLLEEKEGLNLRGIVNEIAERLYVSTPDIVVIPSKLPMMNAEYIGFPYFRSYIWLSEGCLNLKRGELIGLLAHEIYHIKRHSFKWHALNLLSDYTLFGNGFLAMTTNSYQHEMDADEQAARLLKKEEVYDFIKALQIMRRRDRQGLDVGSDQTEIAKKEDEKRESLFTRFKRNIDTIFEIYFGEEILSYIHPPLEERINRIRAIAQSKTEV